MGSGASGGGSDGGEGGDGGEDGGNGEGVCGSGASGDGTSGDVRGGVCGGVCGGVSGGGMSGGGGGRRGGGSRDGTRGDGDACRSSWHAAGYAKPQSASFHDPTSLPDPTPSPTAPHVTAWSLWADYSVKELHVERPVGGRAVPCLGVRGSRYFGVATYCHKPPYWALTKQEQRCTVPARGRHA